MYRFWLFVCCCFLYGLVFSKGPQLNWLELVPIPHRREQERVSVHLPFFRVSSSPPQHHIFFFFLFVSVLLSRPFTSPHVVAQPSVKTCCRLMTRSQAPQTHTGGQGLITLLQPSWWILDLLSTTQTTKPIETLQSSGHFLPVHWKCNVMWSYA